jgi:hypothetical protein
MAHRDIGDRIQAKANGKEMGKSETKNKAFIALFEFIGLIAFIASKALIGFIAFIALQTKNEKCEKVGETEQV